MNIQNKTISAQARKQAAALLQELTLEEKLRQLGWHPSKNLAEMYREVIQELKKITIL